MVLAEHQLSKFPYGKLCFHCRQGREKSKRVSTTFECSLCKVDCWNSHLSAGSPKKRRQENKKNRYKNNVLSKGKLKYRNSAGLVMLQALNKVRNKLK